VIVEHELADERFVHLGGSDATVLYAAGPTLYRREGEVWTPVSDPAEGSLRDVVVVRPDEVWAVGHAGLVLRGDGTRWQAERVGRYDLISLTMWDGGALATSAGSELHRHDGARWTTWTPPILEGRWAGGIYAPGPDAVFLAAQPRAIGSSPDLLSFDGARWSAQSVGRKGFLSAVDGSGPDDVWAVGYHTKAFGKAPSCWRFDGARWEPVEVPHRGALVDVSVRARDDVWIAARGGVLFSGRPGAWKRHDVAREDLTGVHAPPGGHVRVIVAGRTLVRLEDAS
jgi:photosystem II stability/assembly factor-like uncharacterized protein